MPDLETIISCYGPGLTRVVASYERDPALREDLLQDILLSIHTSLPSLRDDSSLTSFIFRIAHNRGVTHIVRQRRARIFPDDCELGRAAATPEEELLASDRNRQLLAAIRRLPLPYRQVMTLVLEDLGHAEIAEALGLGLSNVAVRISRAKVQLRELFDGE